MAEGMALTFPTPGNDCYVIRDKGGRVVKVIHTNDPAIVERDAARLNESFELLGGVTVEVNPEPN